MLVPPVQRLANDLDMTVRVLQQPLPQAFAADCGFQAFAWAFTIALDLPLGGTIGDKQLHDQVTQLLLEHGVWPDRVADRTHQVMTKISHATLRNIVASTRSWAELKACQPCTQTHHDG